MAKNDITNSEWLTTIAENQAIWVIDTSEYPSIIAYENWNLQEQCRKNRPYGVLICLKDYFEAVLKLEILLGFAWADKHMDEKFRINVISQLTSPNLSLGAWMELASILLKALKKEHQKLPSEIPLEQLKKEYQIHQIVNWRNQKIGHGAMELEEDEDFRLEIEDKIRLTQKILAQFHDYFINQKLYTGELCLKGPRLARGLSSVEKISCHLTKSNEQFSVDPYILIRKHEKHGNGVYFFDNQKTRTLTVFQSYADGSKNNTQNPHFFQLRKLLEINKIDFDANPDDPYLDEAESKELDLLQMSHGFVRPEHLIKWLQGCLDKYDKGIFHLIMERGMGKSVFCEQLDRLYDKPLTIDDNLDVRTYHFYRTQSAGISDVRRRIEWQWANQHGSTVSWQNHPRISDLEKEGKTPQEAFCEFLKQVQRYTERNRESDRILIVFDGLDEILDESVWNLIPTSNMLPDGVYLLLTSRHPDEVGVPATMQKRISELNVQESLAIIRQAKENESFLREYIKKTGLNGVQVADIQLLITKADYRVLYLGMLCKLMSQNILIDDLPDSGKIVEVYLNTIKQCYGEIESIHIREILAVLSTLGDMEPLLLKDIGSLTTEGRLTLQLIGMVRDLTPMLKVVRSPEGNRYMIATPDLSEELRKKIPEVTETVREMIRLGLDQIETGYPIEYIVAEPVVAHITELALLLPEKMECLGNNYFSLINTFVSTAHEKMHYVKERERESDYEKQRVLFCKYKFGIDHSETLSSMNNLAKAYSDLGKYDEARKLYSKTLMIRNKKLGQKHPDTLDSMNSLAGAYFDLGNYTEAENLYKKVLTLRKKVIGENHSDTLVSMNGLAVTYIHLGQNKMAYPLLINTLEKRKIVLGMEHPDTLISMNNLGNFYANLERYDEARQLFEEALKIREKIFGPEHPDTLANMNNLATTYSDLKHYNEAMALYLKVFKLRQKVLGEEHPSTIGSIGNIACSYSDLGQDENAEHYYMEALRLYAKVLGEEHPKTLSSMSNLANYYDDIGQFEKACKIREKTLRLHTKVLGAENPKTLISMNNLAISYFNLEDYDKARELFEETLSLRKKVLGTYNPHTISTMFALSETYKQIGNIVMSKELYNEATQLSGISRINPDQL